MLTHNECVGEFHKTFGHPQSRKPYVECFTHDTELVPFRIELMREELKEYKEALASNNLVEMADALGDLIYVTYGAGQCLGMNLDKTLSELQLSIDTPDNELKVNHNIINECKDMILDGLKEIEDILEQFCIAYNYHDFKKMEGYLARLLYATYTNGHLLNFNMDLMFREIHASNMTKVCDNKEDAEQSVLMYREEGIYNDPQYRIENN